MSSHKHASIQDYRAQPWECIQNTCMQYCSCLLLPTIYRDRAWSYRFVCILCSESGILVCMCLYLIMTSSFFWLLINEGSGIGHLQKGTFWVLLFINRLTHSQPPSSSSKTEWKTSLLSHVIKIWTICGEGPWTRQVHQNTLFANLNKNTKQQLQFKLWWVICSNHSGYFDSIHWWWAQCGS